MDKELKEIIEYAKEFECCPFCGNTEIENHFCSKCNRRIVLPDDAYWFGKWLENKYKLTEVKE